MNRKLVCLIFLITILAGVLGAATRVFRVEAGPGTIHIRADGGVEGTTNIFSDDNTTYTLNATINDPIIVERSNIIIDGMGHTVNGPGTGRSFNLTNINNVTIKNTNIKNFDYCIHLRSSFNNTICRNNATTNWGSIVLIDSSRNNISKNTLTAKLSSGIYLSDSSDNIVSRNNITNSVSGVILYGSSNNTISGNNIANTPYGSVSLRSSSNNTVSGNVLLEGGLSVYDSYGNEVVDNLVNEKPLVYLEDASDAVVEDAGQVILVNCSRIKVEDLDLLHNYVGVKLWMTNSSTITGNNIRSNQHGIWLHLSSNNSISGNNIATNEVGVSLRLSYDNRFYHNSFTENILDASSNDCANIWDDGYPSGGNYWSYYNGTDTFHSPHQNITDSDGIGDSPYVLDSENNDSCPLMGPVIFFDVAAWKNKTYYTHIISNSTLSDFSFNISGLYVRFSVTRQNENDTSGFCRVAIPKDILWVEDGWNVFYGSVNLDHTAITDQEYTYLYFSYQNPSMGTETVAYIYGTHVIPEFPSLLVLPASMIAILIAVIVWKRRQAQEA